MNTTIGRVVSALECNISSVVDSKRISGLDKDKRDILILLFRQQASKQYKVEFKEKIMKNQVKLAIFSFVVIFILESSAVSAQWTVESVDAPKNFHNLYSRSLALDANDHPHIAYGGDHLYYAVYDGIGWNYETVDLSTDVGSFTSMALDISGKVHISYYDIIIISTHTTKSFQSTELYLIWASVNTTVFCHCSQIVVSL